MPQNEMTTLNFPESCKSKVKNIREGYTNYCALRERALNEGLDFEELREEERKAKENEALVAETAKGAKTSKGVKSSLAAAKKKFAKANAEVTIKMKDADGNVIDFEDDEPT